ncbi:glutamine-hydrolyzing GMP synthase, partial [uncultured Ruminococcus sp.]|uniref:glutamine-hydrolyzing GMP synthase n=1 Tax=uncultured Ruminococcus sp. TaxID=165186 RepID=UPI0025EBF3F1
MTNEYVLILDFGGQYNQLIARRVRECNVYCEVKPYNKIGIDEIKQLSPKGIIFTGGPQSVYGEDAPSVPAELFELGIPVLGICYGSQLMAHVLGGKVETCTVSEYGKTETEYDKGCVLFADEEIPGRAVSWMSHTDFISKVPAGFRIAAHTSNCPCAAMYNEEKKLYAVQFHPEVNHTQFGVK